MCGGQIAAPGNCLLNPPGEATELLPGSQGQLQLQLEPACAVSQLLASDACLHELLATLPDQGQNSSCFTRTGTTCIASIWTAMPPQKQLHEA